jgi:hypothetical protein
MLPAWRSGRARAPGCAAALALLCACGSGDLVTLGRAVPDPQFGDAGRPLANINSAVADQTPTLTEDLLEIYFASYDSSGPGQGDIWYAQRTSREEAFGAATLVSDLSTPSREVSPAISRDGLSLWLASDRPGSSGGLDIWKSERPSRDARWRDLQPVSDLNSSSDDLPRPLAQGERVMPLASKRDGGVLQTFLATRASRDAPFEVEPLGLQSAAGMAGGFLSEDGRLLFFQRGADGGDLYLTWRRSPADPFHDPPLSLEAVNSLSIERDPWVSSDQTRLFFSSDRQLETSFDIFATTLDLPVFE